MENKTIYHYGVKGMRWGHRKRKEMRNYRSEQYKKHVTESKEQKEFTKLEEENERINNKRKSGTMTLKDNERYQKNVQKMLDLADIADNNAKIKAGKDLVDKYGQESVDRLEKYDKNAPKRKRAMQLTASAVSGLALLTAYDLSLGEYGVIGSVGRAIMTENARRKGATNITWS